MISPKAQFFVQTICKYEGFNWSFEWKNLKNVGHYGSTKKFIHIAFYNEANTKNCDAYTDLNLFFKYQIFSRGISGMFFIPSMNG